MQPADYSNAAHDARERRCANTTQGRTVPACPSRSLLLTLSLAPSRSPSPLVPNRIESHGIKPSPGAFPPLYAVAERRAVPPPLRLDRSVYPAKLSAPPSLRAFDQFSTLLHPPLPSSSSTTPARRFPTTTWSRHPSIHDRTPGGSGLPEYFIYSPPASSSSPP